MQTYHNAAELERARFDVFQWKPGDRWRLVLEAAALRPAIRATIEYGRGGSSCAIPFELEADPNHMTADELADLAEVTAGPIPDVLGGFAA